MSHSNRNRRAGELLDRGDPSDVYAERAALAAVLLDPSRWAQVAVLSVEDFYDDVNRITFRAMKRLAAVGNPIDMTSLRGILIDHHEYNSDDGPNAWTLYSLFELRPWAMYAGYYVDRVKEFSRRRNAVRRGIETIKRAHNFEPNSPQSGRRARRQW
jgi:replicative DNA helicase